MGVPGLFLSLKVPVKPVFQLHLSRILCELLAQVRLVEEGEGGENGEDALVLERLGCGSRLSNISAIMEMFGEQVHSHCL